MKTLCKNYLLLLLLLPAGLFAQSTLTGTVTDKTLGQPLPGVNVTVKGTNKGVSTDFSGVFSLSNLKNGDVIVFSYLGFKEYSIDYAGEKSVSISLQDESSKLEEVVVVGYGSVKKKDATGSVTQLSSKDFNKGTNVTAENLLNGRVAGVTINTSGAPGSGSQIRIRGGSSLFASNDPLIVIDGLPIENNSDKNFGSTSILASINPSTIESMTILKDASATAIYGSRASNGVIIITTKKGGKILSVDYNFQYGLGKLVKTVDVFDSDGFRKIIGQEYPTQLSKLGTANTDWQREIYRKKTEFVDNNVNIKGNLFNSIPLRLTLGNTYQQGLRLTNAFNRNAISAALNPSLFKDHLKLKLNANYTNERNRFADAVEGSAIRFDPTQSVYKTGSIYDGFFEYYNSADGQLNSQAPRNPVAQLSQTKDKGINNRIFGNVELDYKFHFFPDLRAVVNLGFDEADGERTKYAPKTAATSGSNNNIPYGTNEFSRSNRKNKLLDAYLVYNKNFDKLVFDATAGYSYQKWDAYRFITGNTLNPTLGSGFPQTDIEYDRVLIGFFGRTNINYSDKYLLTLSYRRDGSSKFDADNRWGNFPAAAFAWKIKEDFFKENKTISDLKLRLGWGITGQQDIGNNNDYLQQYNTGVGTSQYIFGTTAVPIAVSARLSQSLKWEETATYNAGLDYGIFNNRVTGAVDVFYKESKDLLADVAVADGGNFSNRAFQNIGTFTTKGAEFTLNADVVKSNNINWNVNFNATAFKRKITELKNVSPTSGILVGENIAGTGSQGQLHLEGYVPFSFYLYQQLYDALGKPIERGYADLNGDGVINISDRYIYRNPDPKAVLGFASNLNYKNLDFSFNLRVSIGNRVFNQVNASRAQIKLLNIDTGVLGNIPTSVIETGFTTTSDVFLSDIYVENASFLRMDNITLGYTFPKWLEGEASLRLFTGVQNVFVLTKYSGLDPEVANNGVDNAIYPRQRSFLCGVNVKF